MTDVTAVGVLALLDALTLTVTSLLLVYPVVRYAANVAHTRGFLFLAAAFLLLTVAAVDGLLFGRSLRISVVVFLASLSGLVGTASFARPFCSLPAWLAGDDAPAAGEPAAFEGRFGGGEEQ
jgi:hypothetical protein